jgi:hypothetical protein
MFIGRNRRSDGESQAVYVLRIHGTVIVGSQLNCLQVYDDMIVGGLLTAEDDNMYAYYIPPRTLSRALRASIRLVPRTVAQATAHLLYDPLGRRVS